MGYSPWGHKESDTTEQLTLRNHSRNVGGVCVCVCVCLSRGRSPAVLEIASYPGTRSRVQVIGIRTGRRSY